MDLKKKEAPEAAETGRHPETLYLLFFTEMWERFSFYGMQALLMIYMITETSKGGLGWTQKAAGNMYGAYVGLVYFTPLIGGYIADKFWGNQRCIIVGGFIIILGHLSLALEPLWAFYAGLILLVIGVGFFKPNISSMVGQLYPEGSQLKDSAYTIFYMGINIGSIFGTLLCGYLGERVGWHYGFGAAAIGMLLGQIVFITQKYKLGNIGTVPVKNTEETFTSDFSTLSPVEKDRIWVIVILSAFSMIFWIAWEQMGSSVSVFCLNYTDRYLPAFDFTVPASWFQSLNPIFVVLMAPVLAIVWQKLGQKGKDLSVTVKFSLGLLIMGIAFLVLAIGSMGIAPGQATASVSIAYAIGFYFYQVLGEAVFYPIGLSAVNKLSPPKLFSFMFGVWFVANAIGNYLSGALAGFIEDISSHYSLSAFFMVSVVVVVAAGLVLLLLNKKITHMMHGVR